MSEASLHSAVASFLRFALTPGTVWHHSPNEGRRGWQAQKQVKAFGVRAGWPDIEIIHQGRAHFLELKAAKGRVSPAQTECHADLKSAGAEVAICRSIEDVEAALERWSIPMRAVSNGGKS